MKDSVGGKGTIQVPSQILILPPYDSLTIFHGMPPFISICTKGSIKITQGALSVAFCWLCSLNTTL